MTEVQLALLVLALLFIKHWFADFVVQFDYMVQEKGMYGANGGVHHMLIHMILTYIIVWLLFDPTLAILVATVDGLVHYHIDWLKMNISRWRGLTIKDWECWMWLGADQLAHALTYLVLVLWLISNKLT
jgi:hypothetical protein